jgi:hypothetical protein
MIGHFIINKLQKQNARRKNWPQQAIVNFDFVRPLNKIGHIPE